MYYLKYGRQFLAIESSQCIHSFSHYKNVIIHRRKETEYRYFFVAHVWYVRVQFYAEILNMFKSNATYFQGFQDV